MKLERISRIKGNWNVLRARGKKKRIHNLRAHLGVVQVGGTLQRLCKDSAPVNPFSPGRKEEEEGEERKADAEALVVGLFGQF